LKAKNLAQEDANGDCSWESAQKLDERRSQEPVHVILKNHAGSEVVGKCSKMLIAGAVEIAAMKASRTFLDPR
jgi:hypothetical protein